MGKRKSMFVSGFIIRVSGFDVYSFFSTVVHRSERKYVGFGVSCSSTHLAIVWPAKNTRGAGLAELDNNDQFCKKIVLNASLSAMTKLLKYDNFCCYHRAYR